MKLTQNLLYPLSQSALPTTRLAPEWHIGKVKSYLYRGSNIHRSVCEGIHLDLKQGIQHIFYSQYTPTLQAEAAQDPWLIRKLKEHVLGIKAERPTSKL